MHTDWWSAIMDPRQTCMEELLHRNPELLNWSTALHYAARSGCVTKLTLLMEQSNINVNARSRGRTPLHIAIIASKPTIIQLLVKRYQADINIMDYLGNYPFMLLEDKLIPDFEEMLTQGRLKCISKAIRSASDNKSFNQSNFPTHMRHSVCNFPGLRKNTSYSGQLYKPNTNPSRSDTCLGRSRLNSTVPASRKSINTSSRSNSAAVYNITGHSKAPINQKIQNRIPNSNNPTTNDVNEVRSIEDRNLLNTLRLLLPRSAARKRSSLHNLIQLPNTLFSNVKSKLDEIF